MAGFISDIPENDWEEFNRHLSFDFYELQIPIVPESQWQMVADLMAGNSSFAEDGIPNSYGFSRWQDWGNQLITALNGGD
jgi:hypothetical protein